jgi:flagellar motor switch protein FliM
LQDAQLDMRAILAQAQISLRELVTLSPGDIIPIEAPQQVTLLAGDVPLYQGRFGVSQGRNALKILSGASA